MPANLLPPDGRMQFLGVLFLLAFVAGPIRLLGYCLTNHRVRIRLFFAAWFLLLCVLTLPVAWFGLTYDPPGQSFGQAIGWGVMGVLSFFAAGLFGALALAYFTPTIWAWLQPRRARSSPDVLPAATTAPMHLPETLLLTLIVLPLLCVSWFTLVFSFPAILVRSHSDQPVPWLKATTIPPVSADLVERRLTWTEINLYSQSPSGQWNAISFPYAAHARRLAVLSPDAVLITWPNNSMIDTIDTVVGAVYRKGSPEPVPSLSASDDIIPIPSAGFTTVRCEPDPRCQNHSCRGCSSLTVERFDSLGALTRSATFPIPGGTANCDWWPTHRHMDDGIVYSVYRCPAGSLGEGYYSASPNGIQRITSRIRSTEYTAVEDKEEMESQTQPPTWYHIPWIPDPY